MLDDTIAAIATAPGEAGIGIVRISGSKAIDILSHIFEPKKKMNVHELPSRVASYGVIKDENDLIVDEVLVIVMRNPYSYTKEDVVEIQCHGGIVPIRKIMELVLRKGAVLAEPGEFTKRAFINGRIDLAQAEAVIDIITSKTETGLNAALDQLEGELSEEVQRIMTILLSIIAKIEASIDFPEHDIEELTAENILEASKKANGAIKSLVDTFEEGKIIRDGLSTAIVGRPNVGKSSLLNTLLKDNRAIVTDIPGTTRDVIEEYLNIGGILIKLIDTAGIRETEDVIEKMGVERTKKAIREVDLVILVLDMSAPLEKEDKIIIEMIKGKNIIIAANKSDLGRNLDFEYIKEALGNEEVIEMSVINKSGIEILEEKIKRLVYHGDTSIKKNKIVTNIRHKALLDKASECMARVIKEVGEGVPVDLLSVDVREAWNSLGQITGDTTQEDIIKEIFSKFCIGK